MQIYLVHASNFDYISKLYNPILCVHRGDKQISSFLKFITKQFMDYENPKELVFKFEQWLSKQS